MPATTIPGVSYRLSAPSITVGAGQTATVDVIMTAAPALMKHVLDPTVSATQVYGTQQVPRVWMSEASGRTVVAAVLSSVPAPAPLEFVSEQP